MRISLTPKRKISTLLLILYIWLGAIYANVSYHLGGTILILIGYILLACVLYPWKICFREEDRALKLAIGWFLLFAVVMVAGTEIFRHYTATKTVGSITMGIDTFHMIKSFPIWLAFMLIQGLDKDAYKYNKLILFILLIGIIMTLSALIAIPNFSRNRTAGIITNEMRPYLLRGAMGYELTYSVVLLVPLLFVYAIRQKKIWMWALAIVAVFYIIKSNFFLAIALTVANIGFSLVFTIKNKVLRRVTTVAVLTVLVVLLINQTVLGNLFVTIAGRTESDVLRQRFQQLGEALLYDDYSGRTLNRLDLYLGDLRGIAKSPILGCLIIDPEFYSSGHSTVMGVWSTFGLLGIVPFVQVIRHLYRHTVRDMESMRERGLVLAAYVTFMLFATLNPIFADPHIFACAIWVIPTLTRGLIDTSKTNIQRGENDENGTD